MALYLYLVSQDLSDNYDTYVSVVVVARSVREAGLIYPGYVVWDGGTWRRVEDVDVKVELIGKAAPNIESGVICASFRAG